MNEIELTRGNYRRFYSLLGFDDDPFAYTNADQEDRLKEYFIPPPYFTSVFGDPSHPKSFVVFAPRGGGKSAQRIMIESKCLDNRVLSVTIDQFEFPEVKNAKDITLAHHLEKIIRFSLMGLLITIHDNPSYKDRLSEYEREILVKLSTQFLGGIMGEELKNTLDSLKSFKIKVQEFCNEWLPLLNTGLKLLFKKLVDVDVDSIENFENLPLSKPPSMKYILEIVIQLAQKLGYRSIYVLIDRVDEAELTGNNATTSFQLIEPLLKDLELLEMDGICFKFFLWDQLEADYDRIARTDRIRKETLEWNDEMLLDMWEKRLRAFSKNKIHSLENIAFTGNFFTADNLALIFANRSPRDMIRIGQHLISEQQEINVDSSKISVLAIERGIEKFCLRRAGELFSDKTLNDLRKIHKVDFTIPFLANNIFREQQSSTRNRIMRWRNEGAIVDVERVDNPNPQQKTQVKLFAILDIRLAKVVLSDTIVIDFLVTRYKKCPRCKATVLREWGDAASGSVCHECQFDLDTPPENDTWEGWKRIAAATDTRRRIRSEKADQYSLFDYEQKDEYGGNSDEEA